MLTRLEQKRVPIEKINVRAGKQKSIKNQLQSMCFKDPQLKYLGQKAFASYVRSIHIQKDKEIFQLDKYPLEEFAASLGLPGAPRIKFLKADPEEVKRRKNASRQAATAEVESASDDESDEDAKAKRKTNGVRTKYDRMFERQNQDILSGHYTKMIQDDNEDVDVNRLDGEQGAEDDDLFDVKRRIPAESGDSDSEAGAEGLSTIRDGVKVINLPGAKTPLILDSKRREKLLKSKKKLAKLKDKGTKLVFDDEGNAHPIYELENEEDFRARGAAEQQRRAFLSEEAKRVQQADLDDKALAKEKRRAKKEKRKERERAEAEADEDGSEDGMGVQFGGSDQEDALANFMKDAEGYSDDQSESEVDEKPAKRPKKWFEEKGRRTDLREPGREIETLDDLEAEAAKLLG